MPGSAAGRGRNPFHLTPLELLLQGYPGEFLEDPPQDLPGELSDRELMTRVAHAWVTSLALRAEEKARIHAVWLEDDWQPAFNLDTGRRDELRAMTEKAATR